MLTNSHPFGICLIIHLLCSVLALETKKKKNKTKRRIQNVLMNVALLQCEVAKGSGWLLPGALPVASGVVDLFLWGVNNLLRKVSKELTEFPHKLPQLPPLEIYPTTGYAPAQHFGPCAAAAYGECDPIICLIVSHNPTATEATTVAWLHPLIILN